MKKIIMLFVVSIFFAAPAFSQMMDKPEMGKGDHGNHMMGMGHMDMMGMGNMDSCLDQADKLGLTDEQVKKITPVHNEMKKKKIKFRADLQIAELELKEVMEVRDFDLAKANSLVTKIGDMKSAQHLEMLKSMKEVRGILTDEQFQKMKKLMPMKMGDKKMKKKMMHKHK